VATYARGKQVKLSNNFYLQEFECKCGKCKNTIIDAKLVNSLQKIRDKYNKPVIINSGYRCAKHNSAVGGARNSQHTKGKAADIVVKGIEPREVAAYAASIGLGGIGVYKTFTHVDTRAKRAYWGMSFAQSNRKIAEQVIDGLWGVGAARKRKLAAAGYDYKEIQALVNELLRK
jgi:uncharacterized protein YcbK (DUF882 family)